MGVRTAPLPVIRFQDVFRDHGNPERTYVLGRVMLYAAHEVKTALTVIDLILDAVRRQAASGHAPDPSDVEIAQAALRRAGALLEEILAYGSGRTLRRARLDLAEVVRSVADMLRVVARGNAETGHPVQIVERSAGPGPVIQGDRALLEASLVNLSFNSLQALGTRGGTVWLEVTCDAGVAEVRIRDTGPGLGDLAPEEVFRPYRSSREGGTGLGLSIARAGIEAHGGTLTLRNVAEGGAEAVLRLPLSGADRNP
ncbi:sensor histidine kinase [Limnochorda pilosa]|uniref:histidine kinase n=1 Tax=Limnochorda pilosa TaxID=1555112 RepID=A0A0K2SNX1_LIMPI|nr:HAMP domain-containing sensor histidine kinase [Limnochorda pilosa]BAS28687.1 hypothetical protein LIP_2858 [Limnochorda pilosa]